MAADTEPGPETTATRNLALWASGSDGLAMGTAELHSRHARPVRMAGPTESAFAVRLNMWAAEPSVLGKLNQ